MDHHRLTTFLLILGLLSFGTITHSRPEARGQDGADGPVDESESAELADELGQAFSGVPGFIATYSGTNAEGAKVEASSAAHFATGAAYVSMSILPRPGVPPTGDALRIWCVDGSALFLTTGEGVKFIDLAPIRTVLEMLFSNLEDEDLRYAEGYRLVPLVLMTKDSVEVKITLSTSHPMWLDSDLQLVGKSEDRVIFNHPEFGRLGIHRANGLPLDQDFKEAGDPGRTMVRTGLRVDPDLSEVTALIPADLAEDATELAEPSALVRIFLAEVFQGIVDLADSAGVDPDFDAPTIVDTLKKTHVLDGLPPEQLRIWIKLVESKLAGRDPVDVLGNGASRLQFRDSAAAEIKTWGNLERLPTMLLGTRLRADTESKEALRGTLEGILHDAMARILLDRAIDHVLEAE